MYEGLSLIDHLCEKSKDFSGQPVTEETVATVVEQEVVLTVPEEGKQQSEVNEGGQPVAEETVATVVEQEGVLTVPEEGK